MPIKSYQYLRNGKEPSNTSPKTTYQCLLCPSVPVIKIVMEMGSAISVDASATTVSRGTTALNPSLSILSSVGTCAPSTKECASSKKSSESIATSSARATLDTSEPIAESPNVQENAAIMGSALQPIPVSASGERWEPSAKLIVVVEAMALAILMAPVSVMRAISSILPPRNANSRVLVSPVPTASVQTCWPALPGARRAPATTVLASAGQASAVLPVLPK